jgi:hypothetical protein
MNKKIMEGTAYTLCAAPVMITLPSLTVYADTDLLSGEPVYARMGIPSQVQKIHVPSDLCLIDRGSPKHNSGEEVAI